MIAFCDWAFTLASQLPAWVCFVVCVCGGSETIKTWVKGNWSLKGIVPGRAHGRRFHPRHKEKLGSCMETHTCVKVCDRTLPSMADRLCIWVSQKEIQREWTSVLRLDSAHLSSCTLSTVPKWTLNETVRLPTKTKWHQFRTRQSLNVLTEVTVSHSQKTQVQVKLNVILVSKLVWPLQLSCKHTDL